MKQFLLLLLVLLISNGCSEGGAGLAGTGVGGSTARFAVVGDYLYVINKFDPKAGQPAENDSTFRMASRWRDSLDTFSLANPESPSFKSRLILDLNQPETIHPVGNNIFLGTSSGMMILSLEVPEEPMFLSFAGHFRARDPVVVSNGKAYVTLRSSETDRFSSGINELQIFDVRNLQMPMALSVFPMTSPWGLGVQENRAYICDGSSGLRVLSVRDPQAVAEIGAVNTDICFDVITTPTHVITTGLAGINQYKILADTDTPELLSTITLEQPQ